MFINLKDVEIEHFENMGKGGANTHTQIIFWEMVGVKMRFTDFLKGINI